MLVAIVFLVCFQWSSSGLTVVFLCVPIMQINTRLPLEHHWVLASATVVLVASHCTCSSSGLSVCSNYANYHWIATGRTLIDSISQCGSSIVQWYPSVLTASGLEFSSSGDFPACNHLCIQLVWRYLFEGNGFHSNCNPKYTKNYNGAHIKIMHCVILKYWRVWRVELVCIAEQ